VYEILFLLDIELKFMGLSYWADNLLWYRYFRTRF